VIHPSAPIVGVILAGGSATRMGKDKVLMPIAGKPMLARVADRLSPQVDRIVLSANGGLARFAAFGLPVLGDTIGGGLGPLAGVHAAMLWAKWNTPAARFVASVPTDSPFFPIELVSRLSEEHQPETITIAASSGGTHSVFALWPVSLFDDLEEFLKSGASPKVMTYAGGHGPRFVHFEDIVLPYGETVDPFFNINTPEDAARAEEIAAMLP
jgi:molybdopterin-guanine dinucleotide biosynthesis protein A